MWPIILTLLIGIYLIINLVLPSLFTGTIEAYVIRPILWIILAATTFLIAKQEGLNIWSYNKIRRWQIGKTPLHAGLLLGGFQISLLIMAGIFAGFGQNPNIITPTTFFIFLLYISSMLFGVELTRAYLIKKGTQNTRKSATLIIAFVAMLFIIIQIRLIDITTLSLAEPVELIRFMGEKIIPLLAMSLFASYLAFYGGALPALAYMGILKAFEFYSPILPDLSWITKAFIELIVPTIGFILIQQNIQEAFHIKKPINKHLKKRDPTIGWAAVGIVALLLVLFSFGYFGVQPTVISSGSMQPAIGTGDIVLISEVPLDTLKEGDIIQYKMDNMSIVHRLHEIKELKEGSPLLLITKGDANNEPDVDPVTPEQVTGKVVFTIPKIGWIPIIIKSLFKEIGLNI